MKRWNTPPGWPEPPEGWMPPPGWNPDPSWPAAPEGWEFWVDPPVEFFGAVATPIAPPPPAQNAAQRAAATWQAKKAAEAAQQAAILCPHCQIRGHVTRHQVRTKQGISGGKATGAFFTLGVSMLATGLSRHEWRTQMHCGSCGTEWFI